MASIRWERNKNGSVISIVNLGFYAGASRGDSAVLCHVLAHGGGAISLMSITHPLGFTQ